MLASLTDDDCRESLKGTKGMAIWGQSSEAKQIQSRHHTSIISTVLLLLSAPSQSHLEFLIYTYVR